MVKNEESGAIVVEATISLTAFVFTIFTILSIVNICYIQAKMSVALNAAAKEISQYSYLYYKLEIDELESDLADDTEDARSLAEDTIDGIGTMLDSLTEVENSISSGDFDSLISAIQDGATDVNSLVTQYAEKLADDPKGFIIGIGKLAGSELEDTVKTVLGQVLAKVFMEKNLTAYDGDDADSFLQRYKVVDGFDGLDFSYTSLMAYGESDKIQLVVTYDVSVIKLLNIDFAFTFRQMAVTTAWDEGVSQIDD